MQIHICRFLLARFISKINAQILLLKWGEKMKNFYFFIRKQSICIKRFPISTYNSSTQINRWDCSGTLDDQLIEEYIPLRPRHHSLVHHQQFVQLTWLLCSLLNLDLDLGHPTITPFRHRTNKRFPAAAKLADVQLCQMPSVRSCLNVGPIRYFVAWLGPSRVQFLFFHPQ